MKFFIIVFLIFASANISISQGKADTSKVVLKKISNIAPADYNISDVSIKKDPVEMSNFLFRVQMGVPAISRISIRIADSTGNSILFLIKEKIIAPGSYFIKWEMNNFPSGMYWCEFNTTDFIYRKDFYIY
jgi:hypothetical protein